VSPVKTGKKISCMHCLSIHLTDLCNGRCIFCVVSSPSSSFDTVLYDDIKSFLESNAYKGYDVVNLHGGEPTIHPKFFEILEMIKRLGYAEIHLQTNGMCLADKEFAKKTFEAGVNLFIVSLHGEKKERHESQSRVNGSFQRTIEGIKNVKALKAKVKTNTVITRINLAYLNEIIELAANIGVDHINISNLHPVGISYSTRKNIMVILLEIQEPLEAAIDYALQKGLRITLEGFPYCVLRPDHIPFHLDNLYRKVRMLMRGSIIEDYDKFMNQLRRHGNACKNCSHRHKCGGVYPEYVEVYGWHGITAVAKN
jgi:MoaA/NifB/PqqE/SkfB family radical SAM enzyme